MHRHYHRHYHVQCLVMPCVGVNYNNVKDTFIEYNAAAKDVAAGVRTSDNFGKTKFPVSNFNITAAVYVAHITPVMHYNMGGIQVA